MAGRCLVCMKGGMNIVHTETQTREIERQSWAVECMRSVEHLRLDGISRRRFTVWQSRCWAKVGQFQAIESSSIDSLAWTHYRRMIHEHARLRREDFQHISSI